MAGPWRTLVDVDTLHAHVEDPTLLLLDCRYDYDDPDVAVRAWEQGHLPGAVHAHMDRDLAGPVGAGTGRHPVPDPDDFRATCSRWGLAPGVQVVAYDDVGGQYAARAWWLLRDYGHVDVAVLDGGLRAWRDAGLDVVTDAPRTPPASTFTGGPGHMRAVSSWDLVIRPPRRLVDAREPARHRGEADPHDPVAGRIVGSVNLPTDGNLDEAGCFLPSQALRERFRRALGDTEAKDVAVYCGSGITAAHDILALEIAGYPGAALYPGSWSEWIRKPYRVVETATDADEAD